MKAIYVVIVLYKTTLAESQSYQTLLKHKFVEDYMVYDNSPEEYRQNTALFHKGVTYVRDYENGGLSKAYNCGARKARELGYQRVLLLDQDTSFPDGIWSKYLENVSYPGIVAPLIKTKQGMNFSPVDIRGWNLKGLAEPHPGEYSLYDVAVVNSGCCVPVKLFEQTGGYLEMVKLDFSDFQFQVIVRKIQPHIKLIDSTALQNFSNDSEDIEGLLHRFRLYLECAAAFIPDSKLQMLKHNYQVLRHGLALMIRLHKIEVLTNYFKIFLLKGK